MTVDDKDFTQKSQEERRRIEAFFIPSNLIPNSHKSFVSPSGVYALDIDLYNTGPKSSRYSRGIIRNKVSCEIVADIKRNYPVFWHSWVQHTNGNEYLLCGEDYQGYTIVNLSHKVVNSYLPHEAIKGDGFCWIMAYPSPNRLVLAVIGCYWASPYDLVFYNFSDPSVLPLAELQRFEDIPVGNVCWKDNDIFTIEYQYNVRKSDGEIYDYLTREEQKVLDGDPSLVENIRKMEEYKRSSS